MRRLVLACVAFSGSTLLVTRSAHAHPPHEVCVATLSRHDGETVRLIKRYVDGIFSVDPVQVVLRDAADRTLGETEFGRDVVTFCEPAICNVFRYQSPYSLTPDEAFEVRDGALFVLTGMSARITGGLKHALSHPVGYSAAVLVLMVVLGLNTKWRRLRGPRRAALFAASSVVLFVWWYAVVELSRLSIVIAVALGALGLPIAWWIGRERGSTPRAVEG
jgi:hypothetical protein